MSEQDEMVEYSGFGLGTSQKTHDKGDVFLLVIFRDGALTASAHVNERAAMESALEYLQDELNDDQDGGTLEDLYAQACRAIADEGGLIEVISSPIYGG